MNTAKIRRNQGFTLIELLSVVAIMAITLGFGLPSFKSVMAENRLTTSVNDMVIALQLARSESIKQVKIAGVSIPLGGGDNWDVFIGEPLPLPHIAVIQHYIAASRVTVAAISTGASDETPTYRSDGRLTTTAEIKLKFMQPGSPKTRILKIQPSGRVNVCTPVLPAPDPNCS